MYTQEVFEPKIFISGGGLVDHNAMPPRQYEQAKYLEET
jgi:hypothetical protein